MKYITEIEKLKKGLRNDTSLQDLRKYLTEKRHNSYIRKRLPAIRKLIKKREEENKKFAEKFINSSIADLAIAQLKRERQIKFTENEEGKRNYITKTGISIEALVMIKSIEIINRLSSFDNKEALYIKGKYYDIK